MTTLAQYLRHSLRQDMAAAKGNLADPDKWGKIEAGVNVGGLSVGFLGNASIGAGTMGGVGATTTAPGAAIVGANLLIAYGGAFLSLVAVGLALGSGYYVARGEVEKEWFERGFWRGLAAGLLDWSPRHLQEYFGYEPKPSYPMDQNLGTYALRAYFGGIAYGYSKARLTAEQKRQFLNEVRKRAGRRGDMGHKDRAVQLGLTMRTMHSLKQLVAN